MRAAKQPVRSKNHPCEAKNTLCGTARLVRSGDAMLLPIEVARGTITFGKLFAARRRKRRPGRARSPAKFQWWPCANSQWRFGVDERGRRAFEFLATDETRMEHRFFQARQGWHICSLAIHQRTKLRQERHHGGRPQRPEDAAPTGLKFILVLDSTNMPRLTALGILSGARVVPTRSGWNAGRRLESF